MERKPDSEGNPPTIDEDLMGGLRRGDPAVLRVLLTRYLNPLRRYAEGMLGDSADAQDVVQEAFIRLWEKREGWRPHGSVRAILFTLTRNAAVDLLRRRQREARMPDHGPANIPSFGPSPFHQTLEDELNQLVEEAVTRLPARRQEVFRLVRERGLSYKEVATILEIAPQTVANLMALALSDLRLSLKPLLKSAPQPSKPKSGESSGEEATGSN